MKIESDQALALLTSPDHPVVKQVNVDGSHVRSVPPMEALAMLARGQYAAGGTRKRVKYIRALVAMPIISPTPAQWVACWRTTQAATMLMPIGWADKMGYRHQWDRTEHHTWVDRRSASPVE